MKKINYNSVLLNKIFDEIGSRFLFPKNLPLFLKIFLVPRGPFIDLAKPNFFQKKVDKLKKKDGKHFPVYSVRSFIQIVFCFSRISLVCVCVQMAIWPCIPPFYSTRLKKNSRTKNDKICRKYYTKFFLSSFLER